MSWSTRQKKGILSTIVLWANGFGIGDSERSDRILPNNASGSQGPDVLLIGYAVYSGILFPWEQFYILFFERLERGSGFYLFVSLCVFDGDNLNTTWPLRVLWRHTGSRKPALPESALLRQDIPPYRYFLAPKHRRVGIWASRLLWTHQALRDDFIRNQVLREPFWKTGKITE